MTTHRLFNRYPGAKNPAKYQIWDGDRYDAVIEPFAGSGIFSLSMISKGVRNFFFADADRNITAVYETWIDQELHQSFYEHIDYWLNRFRSDEEPSFVWNCLLLSFENPIAISPHIAAVSVLVRDLTFGGTVRFNRQGRMTAPLIADRLSFLKRQTKNRYLLPRAPEFASISSDWSRAFKALNASSVENTICLIDPPYYSPTCKDAAYKGHNPSDPSTLNLCVNAVRQAINSPSIKRIVVTNYYTEELAETLWELCGNRISSQRIAGKLTQMHQKHFCTTQNQECIWEIGEPAMKQISLFS